MIDDASLSGAFLGHPPQDALAHPPAVVVVPVAYEKTVSYEAGTRHGPAAILTASQQVEFYDIELGYSPVCRHGIATHPSLELTDREPQDAFDAIANVVEAIATADRLPVVLGGEHAISLGVYRGLRRAISKPLAIVQIDAHCDLRDVYGGTPWSHACVARRMFDEDAERIAQVGIRTMCEEESRYASSRSEDLLISSAQQFHADASGHLQRLGRFVEGRAVFVSIDVDGLDPSVIPATGTPEPDGLGWFETLAILRTVCMRSDVVGIDCVELAPRPGLHHADYAAAKLIYKAIAYAMHYGQKR